MTTPFYAPPEAFAPHTAGHRAEVGAAVVLPPEEARHATKVLRKQVGDRVVVVDGVGGWYEVRLTHVARQQAVGEVEAARADVGEPRARVTLAVGLLKQASRFEMALEKAVELGASRIVPLLSERSEVRRLKERRAAHILLAALKQSGRSRLPTLDAPTKLTDLLAAADTSLVALCHEGASADHTLGAWVAENESDLSEAAASALVVVGPEGGFSGAEVEQARECGAAVVSLGNRRLRAETAAITALSAFSLAGLT